MCATTNAVNPLFVEYFDGAAWVTLASFTTATAAAGAGASGWEDVSLNAAAAIVGSTVQIRFRGEDGGGPSSFNGDIGLDEICIEEAPTCLQVDPGTFAVGNETTTSLEASWICTGCTGAFGVIYGPAGFDPVTAASLSSAGLLNLNTTADFVTVLIC